MTDPFHSHRMYIATTFAGELNVASRTPIPKALAHWLAAIYFKVLLEDNEAQGRNRGISAPITAVVGENVFWWLTSVPPKSETGYPSVRICFVAEGSINLAPTANRRLTSGNQPAMVRAIVLADSPQEASDVANRLWSLFIRGINLEVGREVYDPNTGAVIGQKPDLVVHQAIAVDEPTVPEDSDGGPASATFRIRVSFSRH